MKPKDRRYHPWARQPHPWAGTGKLRRLLCALLGISPANQLDDRPRDPRARARDLPGCQD